MGQPGCHPCWLHGGTLSSPFPGPLMRVLVTIIAPIYWSLAHTSGAAQSGFLLTQGTFQHESLLQFATGEGSLTGEPGQLLGKLRLHLPHAPSLIREWSCVCGCCGVLLTVSPLVTGGAVGCCSPFSLVIGGAAHRSSWQGSSCGSPTSPGARMVLALCGWTVSSVAPSRRALAMPWCCCRC